MHCQRPVISQKYFELPETLSMCQKVATLPLSLIQPDEISNNDNEMLIKREPLVYTTARPAVQKG